MNNICWVTPDCFVDCDIEIIPRLCKLEYKIHWIVILGLKNRFCENDFLKLTKDNPNLKIEFFYFTKRARYPKNLIDNYKLFKKVKTVGADINYINMSPVTPWELTFFMNLPTKNTIITAHQGRVHKGMKHKVLTNILRDFVYNRILNVNMFSKSQAVIFKQRYKKSKIFQFVLGLKYFGEPTNICSNNHIVRFLSFGIINFAKNIELLIDAACNLYEKGYKNIRIKIAGKCNDWETTYVPHIKYPELIESDIRLINNHEIPNLFTESDYFVQPYRVVSQSGPFKIAMRYNVPLITSNLAGFMDEMVENVTGFTFESENIDSLERVMINAIQLKVSELQYKELKLRMRKHVEQIYSEDALAMQYAEMFNEVSSKL